MSINIVPTPRVVAERDRLLRRSARIVGVLSTGACGASVVLPGALSAAQLVGVLPLLALLGVVQWRLGTTGAILWVLPIVVIGVGGICVLALSTEVGPNVATENATGALSGGGLGSVAVVLTTSRRRFLLLIVAFVATIGTVVATSAADRVVDAVMLASVGWIACGVVGAWLGASVSRAMAKIGHIGLAYRAERLASASEAQRRHDARLMHDTVLATLTLLAHSGAGVSASALRQQAKEDTRLLTRMRLADDSTPSVADGHRFASAPSSTPGDALDVDSSLAAIRTRFGQVGLTVELHGGNQVLVPRPAGTALLLALTECLENVRRHSGVIEADVTISHDESAVRAIVTDSGVGFDRAHVERDKMGLTESVVARINEVGGNVRVFSSPGSGTTVVLEVPL